MSKPLVLLPYCMAQVGFFEAATKKKGFEVLVLEKDDEIPEIIESYSPDFILGAACPKKVKVVSEYLDSIGMEYEAITLDCDGCFKKVGEKPILDMKKYFTALNKLEGVK